MNRQRKLDILDELLDVRHVIEQSSSQPSKTVPVTPATTYDALPQRPRTDGYLARVPVGEDASQPAEHASKQRLFPNDLPMNDNDLVPTISAASIPDPVTDALPDIPADGSEHIEMNTVVHPKEASDVTNPTLTVKPSSNSLNIVSIENEDDDNIASTAVPDTTTPAQQDTVPLTTADEENAAGQASTDA